MLDVTVKTLDGQNKTFSVPEETTVAQFKEKTANSINIPADTQRLIFHGRVLQDEKLLREYDVHGKVIHVVQRPPPSSLSSNTSSETNTGHGQGHHPHHHHHHHLPSNVQSVVVGSFTIPPNMLATPQHIPMPGGSVNVQINLSPTDAGSGSAGISTSTAANQASDGSAGTGQAGGEVGGGQRGMNGNSVAEAAQRLVQARRNFGLAENAIARLQNPRNRTDDTSVDTGESPDPSTPATATTSSNVMSGGPGQAPNATPASQPPSAQATAREAHPRELASVLRQASRLHSDLSPFITQLCDLAEEDQPVEEQNLRDRQMLVDQVSEALHALSHGYHNISDIAFELGSTPPRQLRAQSLPIYQSAHGPSVVVHGHSHPPTSHASRLAGGSGANNQQNNSSAGATNNNAATPTTTTQTSSSSVPSPPHPPLRPSAPPAPSSSSSTSSSSHSHSFSFSSSQGVEEEGDPHHPASQVYVEVGPDSLTVNSISTTVVVAEEMDDDMDTGAAAGMDAPSTITISTPSNAAPPDPAVGSASTSSSAQQTNTASSSSSSSSSTSVPMTTTGEFNFQGFSSIPGVPADLMNSIVQSVLQAHGVRQGDQVQVNVVPVQVPGGGPGILGGQANEAFVLANTNTTTTSTPAPTPPTANSSREQSTGTRTAASTTASASSGGTTTTTASRDSAAATTTTTTAAAAVSAATTATTSAGRGSNSSHQPRPIHPPFVPRFAPRAPGTNGNAGNIFARIPIFRQRAPIPQGMLPMPLMQPTDIYLPCFSHHFISQAVRERLDQRMQDPQNLGNMMAGMMSTLFGQPRTRGPPISERSSQQPGGTPPRSTGDNSSRAHTSTTATQQGSISANPFATLFSQILGGAGPLGQMAAATAATAAAAAAAAGSNASAAARTGGGVSVSASSEGQSGRQSGMSDAFFARLVQGVQAQTSQVMAGQQSSQTVAAFLQTLGESHTIVSGEGFLTDAFLCVAEQLTFSDMIAVFMGQPQPVGRLRPPMRQFVSQRVLNGSPATDDNLQAATDRVVAELLPDVLAMVSDGPVVSDIDMEATLHRFFSHHLLALFTLIIDTNVSEEQFALQFYNGFRGMLGEFVVLMPLCLQNGQQAFTAILESRLAGMLTGLNPLLQQSMTSMTLQHMTAFQQSQSLSGAQVQGYVVRRSATGPLPASTAAVTATTRAPCAAGRGDGGRGRETTRSSPSSPTTGTASPMEVDCSSPPPPPSAAAVTSPTASVARSTPSASAQAPSSLDLHRRVEGRSRQTSHQVRGGVVVNGDHSPGVMSTPPAATLPSPSTLQDNWQEVVPADWVPVMEADVQRQKSQRSQGPFSDAYLQGMPPKRRRLMSYDQAGSLSNMSAYLPAAVKQAAGRAGVEPVSSTDNMTTEATDAQELQGMLEAEVMASLSDRLQTDHDYTADRFPNAEQYFKPKPS